MRRIPSERKDGGAEKEAADQKTESKFESCLHESLSKMKLKNVWVVGIALLVLISIFILALNNGPGRPQTRPMPPMMAQGVALGIPGRGFGAPYQAGPLTPWGMGRGSLYRPNCPVYQNYGSPAPLIGSMQQPVPLGGNFNSSPYQAPSYQNYGTFAPQTGTMQQTPPPTNLNGQFYPDFASPTPQAAPTQQAALVNPNCAVCPSVTQCFPQAGGAQPVALANPHAGCPSFTQCFPQAGGIQPVALTNPHAGCPSFTQCFPAQAVALTNPVMGAAAAATTATAPPIFRDAVMPHEYRGICENCHIVKADIPIPATAQMPHEYRGVCSNCHKILGAV